MKVPIIVAVVTFENQCLISFLFYSKITPPARKRPANVWNFPKGREKFKHLTEQPPCVCGAGR